MLLDLLWEGPEASLALQTLPCWLFVAHSMTPLNYCFSDLALAHLGGTLLILRGSCVEVLLICALHWSLWVAKSCCWSSLLVTAPPCSSLTAWIASCMDLWTIAISGRGEYRVLTVMLPDSGDDGFPAAWFIVCIVICYFTLGGCAGTEIRLVIVTGKYFTLEGCCGPEIRTAVSGLLIDGFSSCLVCDFLRHVSITVSHVITGACTCPCFREYFSLGGCTGPGSYNSLVYCTAVIVIREYFTLGSCIGVKMSNTICGGTVTPLSLELAHWYCWEGLFR